MNDIYGMRCRMGYGSQFHMLLCGPFLKWFFVSFTSATATVPFQFEWIKRFVVRLATNICTSTPTMHKSILRLLLLWVCVYDYVSFVSHSLLLGQQPHSADGRHFRFFYFFHTLLSHTRAVFGVFNVYQFLNLLIIRLGNALAIDTTASSINYENLFKTPINRWPIEPNTERINKRAISIREWKRTRFCFLSSPIAPSLSLRRRVSSFVRCFLLFVYTLRCVARTSSDL